ncbi:uncharacterized protein LOC143037316 [Oratosquilla oratoria]|uniref:uncharacterized protein LOC143037316 n=1 Tax=Oratosquilla oratoria TaxID=337810 RepID=UPI003F7685C1
MRVNTTKSEVLAISRQAIECHVSLDDTPLSQVSSLKYLGIEANNKGKIEDEFTSGVKKYDTNTTLLSSHFKDRHMPSRVKVFLYTTNLNRILLHGSETWFTTTKTKSTIQTTEICNFRLIYGVTWRDREALNIEPIIELIERLQSRWYGHVKRKPQDEGVHRILQ